jgi:hypothetical protein
MDNSMDYMNTMESRLKMAQIVNKVNTIIKIEAIVGQCKVEKIIEQIGVVGELLTEDGQGLGMLEFDLTFGK